MDLDSALTLLAVEPAAPLDVAELALHLALDEYPSLDVEANLAELDAMAHEAKRYVRGDLAARVAGLCRYLFHDMGFHGNTREYYDPANSYFHLVLERRTGIPITLGAVVMAVGRRVGLDVEGVGLPGHFVVKVEDHGREIVVDPFHGGRMLSHLDCENLVRQVTGREFAVTTESLQALPLGFMVLRMLANLKAIYLKTGDSARAIRVMERMQQLRPGDPLQRRDLGTNWLHAGKPGKAIDHLAAYLAALPDADDADVIRLLLKDARAAVASWN
ncbi:MAG: tetratricopeptide repeat protein [Planctomycetes bacterium]|nr:tetratricopeptide repeat protein [Planctomycetota bacterium]